MFITNHKPCVAISFDSATFKDLAFYLDRFESVQLSRIEPNTNDLQLSPANQYINLVTQDMELRQQVTDYLDERKLDRFSFVHPSAVVDIDIGASGVMIYPMVTLYPHCIVDRDVIIHANCAVAHNAHVGHGCYLSGGVIITGSTRIGAFCRLGFGSSFFDGISIADHITIAPHTVVKKNILHAGVYGLPRVMKKL